MGRSCWPNQAPRRSPLALTCPTWRNGNELPKQGPSCPWREHRALLLVRERSPGAPSDALDSRLACARDDRCERVVAGRLAAGHLGRPVRGPQVPARAACQWFGSARANELDARPPRRVHLSSARAPCPHGHGRARRPPLPAEPRSRPALRPCHFRCACHSLHPSFHSAQSSWQRST